MSTKEFFRLSISTRLSLMIFPTEYHKDLSVFLSFSINNTTRPIDNCIEIFFFAVRRFLSTNISHGKKEERMIDSFSYLFLGR
jgi:hypothetical protein